MCPDPHKKNVDPAEKYRTVLGCRIKYVRILTINVDPDEKYRTVL